MCRSLASLATGLLCSLAVLALGGVEAFNTSKQHIEKNKISKLPELYQIDDYDRCLSRPGALYCVGTFRLTADRQAPSYHYYRMIKEYSSEPRHFNRTLLHRGYCLSTRCPEIFDGIHKEWFSSCAQTQEESLGLKLQLQSYHCDSPTDQTVAIEESYMIFAWVLGALLALNFLGTLYDINVGDVKKSKIIMAWSVKSNWQSLKNTIYDNKVPRLQDLTAVEGYRVLEHATFIAGHVMAVYHQLYLKNPQHIEQLYYQSSSYLWRNGACMLHGFVMLSSFLFTDKQITSSKNASISQLPQAVLRRMARLMPVHLLVVGFAATWWRHTGDGPLWEDLVIHESDVCRRKFRLHALFLHNLVDNDEHCLVQTWSFAADVQLFIAGYLLMVLLEKTRLKPIPVLSGLFFLFALLNGLLAYSNGWEPSVYIVEPERLRKSLKKLKSFSDFYISPLHCAPAHLLGIILAYVHNYIQEQRLKLNESKLFMWFFHLDIPLMISWIMCGQWFYERRSPLITAIYAAIEKPVFLLLLSVYLIGIINKLDSNVLRRLTLWRGWRPLARISMSMLTVHWCVIKTLLASRQTLAEFNSYNVTMDTLTTMFFSYCLALPLTLLVEMPLMKTFTSVLMD